MNELHEYSDGFLNLLSGSISSAKCFADFWCGFWILRLSLISVAKRELAKTGETPELQLCEEWTDRLYFDPLDGPAWRLQSTYRPIPQWN